MSGEKHQEGEVMTLHINFELFRFRYIPKFGRLDFWLLMFAWKEGCRAWVLFGVSTNEIIPLSFKKNRLVIIIFNHRFEMGEVKHDRP